MIQNDGVTALVGEYKCPNCSAILSSDIEAITEHQSNCTGKSNNLDNLMIYLIAPEGQTEYAAFLEEKGHEVFYPSRDLNEHTDTSGFNSVIEKIDAMAEADAVHVIWDDQYKNSYFELGVAMSLSKSIHFVKAIYPDITNVPTYQKVIQMWELSSAEE
jgi:hypothetical protein